MFKLTSTCIFWRQAKSGGKAHRLNGRRLADLGEIVDVEDDELAPGARDEEAEPSSVHPSDALPLPASASTPALPNQPELAPRPRGSPKLAPLPRETRATAGAPCVKPHLSFLRSAAHPKMANPHPPRESLRLFPVRCPRIASPGPSPPPPPVSPASASAPIARLLTLLLPRPPPRFRTLGASRW